MTAVAVTVTVLLAVAGGLTLIRIIRGPSILDRAVATDVLLAVVVAAIATEAAYSRDATALPVLVVLAILGLRQLGQRRPLRRAEEPEVSLDAVLDATAAVCLITGALLSLAAGIALVRFPDLLSRMHAAAKPQVLGLLLVLLGCALRLRTGVDITTLVLVGAFQLASAPVAAHMVGRAAYPHDQIRTDLLVTDELAAHLDRISERP